MKPLDKSVSNDWSKIGILPSASNNFSINFSEACLQIITNSYRLNELKVSTKIQKI